MKSLDEMRDDPSSLDLLILEILVAMRSAAARKRVKFDLEKGQPKPLTARELTALVKLVRTHEEQAVRAFQQEMERE